MKCDSSLAGWCLGVIHSRAFLVVDADGNRMHALVPLLDMMQHSFTPNAWWMVVGDTICIHARSEIAVGEEICVSYGEKSSEAFLLMYGFVPPWNPYDEIELKLEDDYCVVLSHQGGLQSPEPHELVE
eukprot:gnl/MRDRNA2_/MRDRNA2_242252_c0_seq1.p2 gnl/MRDRNA2_/MRDRNA2_242252_c0~~gnl/MRDRNA2_/MRDRNA2_242252_c0_seq1.p2  ORF type:complete len:128 (+),score=28.71 gnl/MRDRNA2_/MRDRNA2_242252_c0_seq1:737-1120(+)